MSSECKKVANIVGNVFKAIGTGALHLKDSVAEFLIAWKVRFTNFDHLLSYIAAEWQKLLLLTLYYAATIALFTEAAVRYSLKGLNGWVQVARGFGQLLNFNSALVLLPVCRSLLTILRTLKFGVILPLDKNIVFHRYIAYHIAIFSIFHGLAHYGNYACCFAVYADKRITATVSSPEQGSWWTYYGLTGELLALVMVIIYAASTRSYRRGSNYTIFWYTHQLFVVYYILLLMHGKFFWMWFLGPAALYIIERILRNVRGSLYTTVRRVQVLPGRVLLLELEKPAFRYEAGQYCFINCPLISRHEWHPYTISSSPEQDYLTFHIRCVGDWTNSLMKTFNPEEKEALEISSPTTPDGATVLIRMDGPFGTSADSVWSYEYVMMIATGIGITPYASLLRHIQYRNHHDSNLKMRKCFFIWLNREGTSFDWFAEVLGNIEENDSQFFEIKTFMTGNLSDNQIRSIMFGSEEFMEQQGDSGAIPQQTTAVPEIIARALYDYAPKANDEIELKVGDEVTVQERNPNGWWFGVNKRTNLTGSFPGNHVAVIDQITKLKSNKNRQFGRPFWNKEFDWVRGIVQGMNGENNRATVGVFLCGPEELGKSLNKFCFQKSRESAIGFSFHKENF